jgi:DNA-binding NtrC family response regulator
MKPASQAKLLRVLETRQFRRVGGEKDIAVDVRVIASTNKDLTAAVARGEFRQDLYYRLKVIGVRLPTLAERTEDIPVLARHFLAQFAVEFGKPVKQLAEATAEVLSAYDWPGNVRELRNVIERLVILEAEQEILPRHLPPDIASGTAQRSRWLIELPTRGLKIATVERELVRQAMERVGGNQSQAAELLGLERDALRRRLIKYGFLDLPAEENASTRGGTA